MDENHSSNTIERYSRRQVLQLAGGVVVTLLGSTLGNGMAFAALNGDKKMKIVILTGSPHEKGTSALLTDEFIAGAKGKGHTIVRFDTAFEQIGPCRACYYCDSHDGQCFQRDAMDKILPEVLSADMIVLVTPIYYYNMSAQLKVVIDRFHAKRDAMRAHPMKSAVIATCGGSAEWSMDGVDAHYRCLLKYLPWDDQGVLYAKKVYARKDIEATGYPDKAKEFGQRL